MRTLLPVLFATLGSLPAQVIDTLGSTANPATTGSAKANLFQVNDTRIVLELEWYLSIPPGQTTLTFFSHRHHSRNGFANLEWTLPVTVTGTGAPAWYSTGPIALPLVTGNHYTLGVAYSTPLTYYFSIANPGAQVSFGNWQRGHTPAVPLQPTLQLSGNDGAQYHQRITSVPVSYVVDVGTGCTTTSLVPRLVAGGFFSIATSQTLTLVDAAPSAITVFALAVGPTLPAPLPVFGCDLWLNLGAFATLATVTDSAGGSNLTLGIPNNLLLVGQTYSSQALVFAPATPQLTNAVQFTIN